MIVRRFKINMIPGGKMAEVALSQYDSDVTLEFELYASDGTFVVESGTTAVFRGSKPDKNGISVAAELESTIDSETGKNIYLATVDVIPQMTAVAGRSLYELSLQKGGEELNTANFILDIERAPLDADTLPSESVIRELVDVIDKADEIIAAAEAVTTAIDDTLTQQGKAADAKKVGDEISDIKADLNDLEPGLSLEARLALLACFRHVLFLDADEDYYGRLERALEIIEPEEISVENGDFQMVANHVFVSAENWEDAHLVPSKLVRRTNDGNLRYLIYANSGIAPLYEYPASGAQNPIPTSNYPIPIPEWANRYTIKVYPQNCGIWPYHFTYDESSNSYINHVTVDNWQIGEYRNRITNNGNMYLIATLDSAQAVPTNVVIKFERV